MSSTPPSVESAIDSSDTHSIKDQPAPAPTTPRRIPDFYRRWLKKMVTIKCISGAVIDGLLVAYSPYDLVLEIAGGEEIILPKHSILFCAGPKSRSEAI